MIRRVLGILLATGLTACTMPFTHAIELADEAGRPGLMGARLGDEQQTSLTHSATRFSVDADCESSNVGVRNSRKAFLHQICRFAPEDVLWHQHRLDGVDQHYIDGRLLRIDIRLVADADSWDALVESLTERYGPLASDVSDAPVGALTWIRGTDHILLTQSAASDGLVRLHVLDAAAADRAPSLRTDIGGA